jgi:hypothetical protein
VDPNQFRTFQWRTGGLGIWLAAFLALFILSAIVPDWLINGILILMGLMFIAPIVGVLGLQWWLQRSLVQGNCPICDYPLSGLKQVQVQCPSCGELLKVNNGQYQRTAPPGTVDVQVVEVNIAESSLED